ncbi:unnamed protein product [Darwinula stevensoni]|uniref:Uncharacterized protein n=1 Tax=Darwinula stevensoni TaxID=69355 RepID=A0A7R8XJ14_9CRUS|nr:unnamed protein product [Darwinula stevensoni]CAG0894360.1 unnamed protein product [Darwinula stevensoni]
MSRAAKGRSSMKLYLGETGRRRKTIAAEFLKEPLHRVLHGLFHLQPFFPRDSPIAADAFLRRLGALRHCADAAPRMQPWKRGLVRDICRTLLQPRPRKTIGESSVVTDHHPPIAWFCGPGRGTVARCFAFRHFRIRFVITEEKGDRDKGGKMGGLRLVDRFSAFQPKDTKLTSFLALKVKFVGRAIQNKSFHDRAESLRWSRNEIAEREICKLVARWKGETVCDAGGGWRSFRMSLSSDDATQRRVSRIRANDLDLQSFIDSAVQVLLRMLKLASHDVIVPKLAYRKAEKFNSISFYVQQVQRRELKIQRVTHACVRGHTSDLVSLQWLPDSTRGTGDLKRGAMGNDIDPEEYPFMSMGSFCL